MYGIVLALLCIMYLVLYTSSEMVYILSMSYADAAHIVLNMHAKVARKSCDL